MERLLLLILAVALSSFTSSHQHNLCHGFTPENDLRIPEDAKEVSNVTEQDTRDIISILHKLYDQKFKDKKQTLSFNLEWKEDQFNAYTNLHRGRAQVTITGGMIRHPLMTKDGVALVLCHEVGHHLGGKPKHRMYWIFPIFASAEGQADYFATLKCLRKYFRAVDGSSQLEVLTDNHIEKCFNQFTDFTEREVCLRSSAAGLRMAQVLNSLRKEPLTNLSLDTKDPKVVKRTFRKHPNPQCRLDTYAAGSLCEIDHTVEVDHLKDGVGQCNRKLGHKVGLRPLCWYKPSKKSTK